MGNSTTKRIGTIGNYYGELEVKEENGSYYWAIEDHWGYNWEEITPELYQALLAFQEKLDDEQKTMREDG